MNTQEQEVKPKKTPLQTSNEYILERVSLEFGLPIQLIREVVQTQSAFTRLTIKEGGMDGILWPVFGKIRVKAKKVHAIHYATGDKLVNEHTTKPTTNHD